MRTTKKVLEAHQEVLDKEVSYWQGRALDAEKLRDEMLWGLYHERVPARGHAPKLNQSREDLERAVLDRLAVINEVQEIEAAYA